MKFIRILNRFRPQVMQAVAMAFAFVVMSAAVNHEPGSHLAEEKPAWQDNEVFANDPGYKLFKGYGCKTCHRVNKRLIGPALAGVTQRREKEWIYRFVKNSAQVIAEKDSIAVGLYNEYQVEMPEHEITNQQIDQILAYIKKVTK